MENRIGNLSRTFALFLLLSLAALGIALVPSSAYAADDSASISVDKSTIMQGETLTITTKNSGDANHRWVGLYAGEQATTYDAGDGKYQYLVMDSAVGETSNKKSFGYYYPKDSDSSTVTLTGAGKFEGDATGIGGDAYPVSLKPGKYVLALMDDSEGLTNEYRVVAKCEFTVTAGEAKSNAEMTATSSSNDEVAITTKNVEQNGAWVGIYKRSDAVARGNVCSATSLAGWYVSAEGETTATLKNGSSIEGGNTPWYNNNWTPTYGEYTALPFDETDASNSSAPWRVTRAVNFSIDANGSVTTDNASYAVGDAVKVTASDPSSNSGAWVGIYPKSYGIEAGDDLSDTSSFSSIPSSIAWWMLPNAKNGSVTIQNGAFSDDSFTDGSTAGSAYKINDQTLFKLPDGDYTVALFDQNVSGNYVTAAYDFKVGKGNAEASLSMANTTLHVADGVDQQISTKVKLDGASSLSYDAWIGLYGKDDVPGTGDGTVQSIAYINTKDFASKADSDGYVDLTAVNSDGTPKTSEGTNRNSDSATTELNLKPGDYKVILFGDGGYSKQLKVVNFTVTDHEYELSKVIKEPTCTQEGSGTYKCKYCDSTKTMRLPMVAHSWDKSTAKFNAKDRTHTLTCSVCGETKTEDCTFDNGVITKKPTATATGVRTYTCTVCGGKYTVSIPAAVTTGAKVTVGKGSAKALFKVTSAKKHTVSYVKSAAGKNAKTAVVPASIKLADGKTYKVTNIATKAFNSMKKLTNVTVGENIVSISKSAFYKTPKMKTLTVKSKKLTSKKSVAGSFKKSQVKNLTVKAPKSVKSKYKKVSFTKKNLGVSKKVTVK
ncbi:MAG: leucine-rich repeat protein [Eggerthellaceae bacterium]|jgi:hypothetical protein